MRVARIKIVNESRVQLHLCSASRERVRLAEPYHHRKRIVRSARELHDHAMGIDQLNAAADLGEADGSALLNLDGDPVRKQTHYIRRLDPWNRFELHATLLQRDVEDVASDVGSEHFHYL